VLNAVEARIAQRLADARRERGWTLAATATRSGLSVTHLSRLENGLRQPSIGALIQLARCYGLSLGQLVGEEPAVTLHVFRVEELRPHDGPDGRYAALSGLVGHHALEAVRLELPPGAGSGRAAQHTGEEWLLVESGLVRLELGDQVVDLRRGDAAHFDAQTPHHLANLGTEPATVCLVTAAAQSGGRTNGHHRG
jgi:transcriptional regulator with XRE-family HTH domain